jgi:hypothetical protein
MTGSPMCSILSRRYLQFIFGFLLMLGVSQVLPFKSDAQHFLNPPFSQPPPLGMMPCPGSIYGYPEAIPGLVFNSNSFGRPFPALKNLEVGFLYQFSDKGQYRSLLKADILVPLRQTCSSIIFSQGHYGYNRFQINGVPNGGFADYRTDAFAGGGYRVLVDPTFSLGLNGFWDFARVLGSNHNSWGIGLEATYARTDRGILDLTINQYGNLFGSSPLNIWRNGDLNFDVEAGYSVGFSQGLGDLRIKANAYRFDAGDGGPVGGYKLGAEVTSPNGALLLACDVGRDRYTGTYSTVQATLNVSFDTAALLQGQNPISPPQPVIANGQVNPIGILTRKVRRNTNIPITGTPYFEFQINGPYIWGSGTYVQDSPTHGVWTVTYQPNIPPRLFCEASSYTVRLVGDTSTLSFPLIVTITPINSERAVVVRTRANWDEYRVISPETTTMISPSDILKTIPPDENSVGVFNGPTPALEARTFQPGSPGPQGSIIVTAPGVQPLTIDIISTN